MAKHVAIQNFMWLFGRIMSCCVSCTQALYAEEKTHLCGNSVDGIDTVGDIGELETRGKLARESVELRHDVSDDTKHCSTAILYFTDSSLVELVLALV